MSSDFDDSDGLEFFQGNEEPDADARPLGLVVPPKARLLFNAKREIVWDELFELERAYRARGRPFIEFEEGEDDREP